MYLVHPYYGGKMNAKDLKSLVALCQLQYWLGCTECMEVMLPVRLLPQNREAKELPGWQVIKVACLVEDGSVHLILQYLLGNLYTPT